MSKYANREDGTKKHFLLIRSAWGPMMIIQKVKGLCLQNIRPKDTSGFFSIYILFLDISCLILHFGFINHWGEISCARILIMESLSRIFLGGFG